MSDPSYKAIVATDKVCSDRDFAELILEAAHDPALGLDRSVCLRDVVEGLRRIVEELEPVLVSERGQLRLEVLRDVAAWVEREFTAHGGNEGGPRIVRSGP